jgi:sugar (pentulose or hexulose) kinase
MFDDYRSTFVVRWDMAGTATVVLDVGKTLSKLGLWSAKGELLERRTRPNSRVQTRSYVALDATGIEDWVGSTLYDFAGLAEIGSIIPVSHGAAAAIVRDGKLALSPIDYESPIPSSIHAAYRLQRDPFSATGSPALTDGLNLGAQLYYLQSLDEKFLDGDAVLLPWAQYWSWLLSGVASSEVTSLGCHTDLWQPLSATPSAMAVRHGWDRHLAPLKSAASALGPIAPSWAHRTGLPPDTQIHCGVHDSNAALIAARGFPEIANREATVLSTGTWFVAMRTPARVDEINIAMLSEDRDCLLNVDAYGKPVPSARFMGGREIELLTGVDTRRIDIRPDQPALLAAVSEVLRTNAMVLPTFAPGAGPYGRCRGQWINMPTDQAQRRAAVCLYAALVADTSLDLICARERLLIEGRFAESEVFVRALAALRPDTAVYVGHAHSDVSFGAMRLLDPKRAAPSSLTQVQALADDLSDYKYRWRHEVERMEGAAA